jgi:hypothetical protein
MGEFRGGVSVASDLSRPSQLAQTNQKVRNVNGANGCASTSRSPKAEERTSQRLAVAIGS